MRESPGVSANVCEAVGRNSFLFPVNCFILPDKSHHQRVNMSILFDRILLIVPYCFMIIAHFINDEQIDPLNT